MPKVNTVPAGKADQTNNNNNNNNNNNIPRLKYRLPWIIFTPTFLAFFLLNYLACCTTVNNDGTDLILSPAVTQILEERRLRSRTKQTFIKSSNNEIKDNMQNIYPHEDEDREEYEYEYDDEQEYPFNFFVFFENDIMRNIFKVSLLFGGMEKIRLICTLAWLAHCLELGIAVRICLSCKASLITFILYTVLTVMGGITQLFPLIDARDEYILKYGKDKKEKKEE